MTETQMQKIKTDAMATIEGINPDKMTEKQYTLLGASMGVIAYNKIVEGKPIAMQEPVKLQMTAPASQGFNKDYIIGKIYDELNGSQSWLNDYSTMQNRAVLDFAWDESNHAAWLIQLAKDMGIDVTKEIEKLQKLQSAISKS